MNPFIGVGITDETTGTTQVAFPIEKYFKEYQAGTRPHPFCEGIVTGIKVGLAVKKDAKTATGEEAEFDTAKEEDKLVTLEFTFNSFDGTFTFVEKLWSIKGDDPKAQSKMQSVNGRIVHFWNELTGSNSASQYLAMAKLEADNPELLISKATSTSEYFVGYFTAIAHAFNTAKGGSPVFKNKEGVALPVRFKVVRANYGRQPNQLQMPLGNVLERIVEGKPSILAVKAGEKYELIETGAKANPLGLPGISTPGASAGAAASDAWPSDI